MIKLGLIVKNSYLSDRHTFWIRKQQEAVKDTEGNIMKTTAVQANTFSKMNILTTNSDND